MMAGFLFKAKAKLYALGAIVLAVLAFVARYIFLKQSRDKFKKKAEEFEAQAHRAKVVAEKDNELEAQSRSHRAEVKNDIKTTGDSRTFRDPDELWDDPDT